MRAGVKSNEENFTLIPTTSQPPSPTASRNTDGKRSNDERSRLTLTRTCWGFQSAVDKSRLQLPNGS